MKIYWASLFFALLASLGFCSVEEKQWWHIVMTAVMWFVNGIACAVSFGL